MKLELLVLIKELEHYNEIETDNNINTNYIIERLKNILKGE